MTTKQSIQHTITTIVAYGANFFLYNSVTLMIKSNDFTVSSQNVREFPKHHHHRLIPCRSPNLCVNNQEKDIIKFQIKPKTIDFRRLPIPSSEILSLKY